MAQASHYRPGGSIVLELKDPTWIIDRFRMHVRRFLPSEPLISEAFTNGSNNEIEWYLALYPGGYTKALQDFMSLFIMNASPYDVEADVTFSLLGAQGQVQRRTDARRFVYPSYEWVGIHKFESREYLLDRRNGLIADDLLRLNCSISRVRICREAVATWRIGGLIIEKLAHDSNQGGGDLSSITI